MAQVIAPQGRIGLIDDPEPLDLRLMKFKSVSMHWEAMFTRPMHATADIERQHDILNTVADLIDNNTLVAPRVASYGTINAANLRRAHAALEDGHTVGKITLAGF
jgi:NADPH:quinone reductase-like Zn-dependent oxidoreductase